jgi:hypothetical protein
MTWHFGTGVTVPFSDIIHLHFWLQAVILVSEVTASDSEVCTRW